ncbi:hypothetical protein BGW39_004178 [Mortierella sp. 14UC]|nr:hypothetical protein BGW39_004178 [Mortierella sp. 14UC]
MKLPTILSILVAAPLTATVYAAPAPFVHTPTTATVIPSTNASGNGTATPNDKALFASLVKYDYKKAAEVNKIYDDIIYSNRPLSHTNLIPRAVATSPVEILPYCVGVALNPTRVKIFKNRMACDIKDWTSLFTFTAHTNYDKHHAPFPICVGKAGGPDRSMLFSNRTSCSVTGWATDFAFYESGTHGNDGAVVNPLHESTVMWQAYDPHRMMLYPYYQGGDDGWLWAYNLQYRSRWRLAQESEYLNLQTFAADHANLHKTVSIVPLPDAATHRCVQNLLSLFKKAIDYPSQQFTLAGKDDSEYVADAQRDECTDIVPNAVLRANQRIVGYRTLLEAVVDGKVHAAVSIPTAVLLSAGWASHLRIGLQESMRTGRPVAMERVNEGETLSNSLAANIGGVFVVVGKQEAFTNFGSLHT